MIPAEIIKKASELAYEENADQIIGKIQNEWSIVHIEDMGRQAQMSERKFLITSQGEVKVA